MEQDQQKPRPLVLMILDGYGISFLEEGNAVFGAGMEHMNRYLREYPCAVIKASGIEVGLPWGEPGNSETGHRNIGSGKVLYQPLPQITLAVRDKSFSSNPAFVEAMNHVKERPNAALHLIGCMSTGGVHSHIDHYEALLSMAREQGIARQTYTHAFLDGRDTLPKSAETFLEEAERAIRRTGAGPIATIIGRYYAMDRNNNWDRTQAAYNALVHGTGTAISQWRDGIREAYEQGTTDETVPPMVMTKHDVPIRTIEDGDAVIFFNFRPDRARQLTFAFVKQGFHEFPVEQWEDLDFVTMAEYEPDLPVTVAFPEAQAERPIGRVISDAGLSQLRIAETEKYAHVTYYFNSGRELPYPGENRVLIPSPNVKNYADTPGMSADAITDRVVVEIEKGKYDVIVMNYANPDMLGHTGKYKQTVESLTMLDTDIFRVTEAALAAGGAVLLTCDHGNAEEMVNPTTHEVTTDHTSNPVPILYIAGNNQQVPPKSDDLLFQVLSTPIGVLADVGPTLLDILQIQPPPDMTAHSLLPSLV